MLPESSASPSTVNVVVMWHMHQPQYQELRERTFVLPWTYLHAIKDYWDMGQILQQSAAGKAVVNFSATLLEQLSEYASQLDGHLSQGTALGDPLLASLARPVLSSAPHEREKILQQCLRANDKNLIQRHAPFHELVQTAREALAQRYRQSYLNDQYFFDLLTWYHLAWLGETLKQSHRDVRYLINKERHFTMEDRRLLLVVISEVIHAIVPLYRQLADEGKVELTFTPENHPILPLLLDFNSAREVLPDLPLPNGSYPGGEQRANAQIQRGLDIFTERFGRKPKGCWPGEGALCERTLKLLGDAGLTWTASGAGVLFNSLKASNTQDPYCIHHAYRVDGKEIACFFRDDHLSDLIGFQFHDWNVQDAVSNLVHHIENIHDACQRGDDTVVAIILDGENCWEYYPQNGYHFLHALYTTLSHHPRINLTTFSDYLKQHQPRPLPRLTAGSWVYGNLTTWVGNKDKNYGWELLIDAKKTYETLIDTLPAAQQRIAETQLSVCEASDWFWWFGDYNAAESVSDFDQLYRLHLTNLYLALGVAPPAVLQQVISVGTGSPEMDGTMRRGKG